MMKAVNSYFWTSVETIKQLPSIPRRMIIGFCFLFGVAIFMLLIITGIYLVGKYALANWVGLIALILMAAWVIGFIIES